jgi:alpha-glucosidase
VDAQQGQPDSLLGFYTQLLHWRRGQPVLVHGDMALLSGTDQVLAYERSHEGQRMGCVFNFSPEPATWDLPAGWDRASAHDLGLAAAHTEGRRLVLQPWGGLVATL